MPDFIDVDIAELDPSGDGIARDGRRTIAVPFTIPGERVRVRLTERTPGGWRATLLDVLRPSPHRVVPRCPHFGPCGGCSWQHIAYAEQLRLKATIVDSLVRDAVPGAPAARPAIAGAPANDPWGYRQKVHFVFGADAAGRSRPLSPARSASGLVMGHYARGSRRVVPVRECAVHDERGNRLAFALRDLYARAGIGAALPARRPSRRHGAAVSAGVLKSVAVRVGRATGEMMATLVVSADRDRALRGATRKALAADDAPTSFHVNIHPQHDRFIFGPETRKIAGSERLREEIAGTPFLMSPTAFFQTNVQAAEVLVRLVREALPPASRVLDLYAGAGLFAIPLALAGHEVIAVEENRSAVADGEATLRLNPAAASRCRFVARRAEQALRSVRGTDAVVMDPPREGCTAEVLDAVFGRLRPPRAVYVSCNPESLARDLRTIAPLGYKVESIQPVDMFPHTAHIETVVVIRRQSGA